MTAVWGRLPVAWRRAIVAAVVLRVALAIGALAFGGVLEGLAPVNVDPIPDTGWEGWRGPAPAEQGYGLAGAGLERFDALWYLAIAQDGYPPGTPDAVPGAAAFFPLYPLLVGLLGRVLGSVIAAANVVSLLAAVAAFAGVHRLVEGETGDAALAGRSLVAVAVFPTAFFLVAPFTEGLFLATSAWALVWARRGRWLPAAGLAAAAGATRNVGVLLVIPLVIEVVRQHREQRRPGPFALLASLAPVAGLGAFALYLWGRMGTPLAPFQAQGGWQRRFEWPWSSLGRGIRYALGSPGSIWSGYHTLDLLVFIPVLAAVVWLLFRAPLPYGVYAAAHVIVWLAYPFYDRPLMSTARFALALVPVFWAIGRWTRRPAVATSWVGVSAALLGVHALLFVNWLYVF